MVKKITKIPKKALKKTPPPEPVKPAVPPQPAKESVDDLRLKKLLRSIFRTPEGKEAINLMKGIYSFYPICVPGAPEGSNELRQGTINFVRALIYTIEHEDNGESYSG